MDSHMNDYVLNIFPLAPPDKRIRLSCMQLNDVSETVLDPLVLDMKTFSDLLARTSMAEVLPELMSCLENGEPVHLPCSRQDARTIGLITPVN